jgi:predicted dehydrogenase
MVRAAIVGLGWWGLQITESLRGSSLVDIVIGVDPDAESRARAQSVGLQTCETLDQVLRREDIDAVIICSPHRFHRDQMLACAAAGKHIFCEKPFSTTSAEAEEVLAAVERAGVALGIGHERRFESAIVELQRQASSGELGQLLVFEGNFSQDKFLNLDPSNWRLSPVEAPVGPLSATGIHLVDLAISLFGKPVSVLARLSTQATTFANGDTLAISLSFGGGQTALITAILTTPFVGRVALYGSTGWVEIRDRSHPEKSSGWDVISVKRGEEPETHFVAPEPTVRWNIERFAESIEGIREYPVPHEQIRANVRAFEAISRSAVSGQIVEISTER